MTIKPKCIIVTGRAGSGKTTIAKKLGERLRLPVLSRDEIKEGYVNTFSVKHDELPPNTNALVTDVFFDLVNHCLTNNVSIVIEAAFQHGVWEPRMQKIIELASPTFVVCSAADEIAATRHLERGLADPKREFFHGDKRVTHYRETGEILPPANYEPPKFNVPTIEVSTVGDYVPSIDDIVKQIERTTFR